MDSKKMESRVKAGDKFGRHREWKAKKLLNKGGFGVIWLVKNKNTMTLAALKAEDDDPKNGGSAIKIETEVLKKIHRKQLKPHFTELFHSVARRDYHYMIITRLGKDLRDLRLKNKDGRFSEATNVRVGIQCLYALKLLHDVGYIHRDIKPVNFMIGHQTDQERVRIVHLVDFGLARRYARENRGGTWTMRRARKTAQFRGTYRYAAPAVHDKFEQGRRDDVWSWLYMLIELQCGLPWEKETARERIEWKKLKTTDEKLLEKFPNETHWIVKHLRDEMDCYKRPDYAKIYECMEKWMRRVKTDYQQLYDWEQKEDVKIEGHPPAWANPKAFFASDPIRLNGPPANMSEESPQTSVSL